MATSRAILRGNNPKQITVGDLAPGEFGVFDNDRIVYRPFGGGPPQAFDGGFFAGHTASQLVRKLQRGEVVEITVQ